MAFAERVCAICNEKIEAGKAPVVCVRCHALYHHDCWQKVDRCVVYGCNEPKENYGLLDTNATEMTCAKCGEKNPRAVQKCLHCGTDVGTPFERQVFVSFAGWRATNDQEFVDGLSRHWDSGIRHLLAGDIEHWCNEHGHKEWASKAAKIRQEIKQRSIALETFLQSTGLVETPTLTVNPPRIILESSSPRVEKVLDITNSGRGYLFGKISIDVPWVTCNDEEYAGNNNRVELYIDMEQIPNGSATGTITLKGAGQEVKVEIKATRIGIENALKAYHEGNISKARALCRRLADSQTVTADVSLVLAACYLADDNKSGVASVLSKCTGSCEYATSDVLQVVYDWFSEEGQYLGGVDHFSVLEAMLPTAEGELKNRIKADLAKLALERVVDLGTAVADGANLWQDKGDVKQSVNELLAMAVELDPSRAEDAAIISKKYSGQARKSGRNRVLWNLIVLLVLGGVGYGVWWVNASQKDREYQPIAKALEAKDYMTAIREARILCDNNPDEMRFFQYYLNVLEARVKDEIANKNWDGVTASVNQMRSVVSGRLTLHKLLAAKLCSVAKAVDDGGCPTEARLYYEMASEFDANNTDANVNKVRLASTTDAFWKIYSVAKGPLGISVCNDCAKNETVQKDLATLISMGVTTYSDEMYVMFCDLIGNGVRDLVVMGCNAPGKTGQEVGHYDVYKMIDGQLSKEYSGTCQYTSLVYGKACNFSGEGRLDIAMYWQKDKTAADKEIILLANKKGKFVDEIIKSTSMVEFADHDGDRRVEVWFGTAVDGSEYKKGICLYSPMVWTEPGFIKATGNYDSYYRARINELQKEAADNPYDSSSAEGLAYAKRYDDAIAAITKMMHTAPTTTK